MTLYQEMQRNLAQGWNTWNTRSVLSHVLLPEGFAINLGIREYVGRRYLKEALVGRKGQRDELVRPGPHAYDGSYTELGITGTGYDLLVQSAVDTGDQVILVTPRAFYRKPPLLVAESGILWNRPGSLTRQENVLVADFPGGRQVQVYGTKPSQVDPYIAAQTPYLAMQLDSPVGISTGRKRSLEEIQAIVQRNQAAHAKNAEAYQDLSEVYKAIQTVMAWDTVYEPEKDRVVSPVSRIWNVNWGGYVLFDWDNYFAAFMASIDNKEIAYANAVEMTREITETGFVPNFASPYGLKSRDRSEPPVGALMVREIYRKYREEWFLEEVFDNLLQWNRFWHEHRQFDGLLCWGSDPYEPWMDTHFELEGINQRQGAAWESGLDNLPVYDDVPFDSKTHLLQMQDTGLNSLYVADCEALADIADILGKKAETLELRQRADQYRQALKTLWNDELGTFCNRRTDTGKFSPRLAPITFYPLLAKAANQAQAERMMAEHFYNPSEFWGDWMLPTIARNDPAYPDQDYWRGRIWGPMNFLVYLALRKYDLPQAQKDLAEKSKRLLLKEWLENGHVYENYDGNSGVGGNVSNADAFYHWGGLLGIIALIQSGYIDAPEKPLSMLS
jgi:putative isomerase